MLNSWARSPRLRPTAVVLAVSGLAALVAVRPAASQTAPGPQQEVGVLRVDLNDPELKRLQANPTKGVLSSTRGLAGAEKIGELRVPVLAFSEVPQLVRNALGPNAQPTKPRKIITDPEAPVWYHLTETYGDISISIDADLRINHAHDADFQIKKRPLSSDGQKRLGKTPISVFDNTSEQGREGIIVEYTVHKFPDVPYTVAIECRRAVKNQCRDLATVTKDQDLLRVISTPR